MSRTAVGIPVVHILRPRRAMSFAVYTAVLVTLLAASSAPTPLYSLYQQRWNLSPVAVTVVFSAYALALLLALLLTGTLSDHLGRRPVLAYALAAQAASMLLLAAADGIGVLIAARTLQGAATGVATCAAGAALLDTNEPHRPGSAALANSIAPAAGMAIGVSTATLLIQFAPAPTTTVYLLFAALFAVEMLAIVAVAETAPRRPGALRSLLPRLTVAPAASRELRLVGSAVVAVWALGGFYSSLGPALTRLVAPDFPMAAGGMIFFAVTAAAVLTVWVARRATMALVAVGSVAVLSAAALTMGALHGGGLPALFTGAVLAGVAFGAVSQGALRMTTAALGEQDRAGALSAYYLLSYLAMSLPAIAAGAVTQRYGLETATHAYAVAAVLLGLAALAALARRARAARPGTSNT